MIHRFKTAKHATRQSIEIFVDRIEQLFNSMDPSPFHEKIMTLKNSLSVGRRNITGTTRWFCEFT